MSGLLAKLPIFLVSDQNSGLWGVAMKSAGTLAKDLS